MKIGIDLGGTNMRVGTVDNGVTVNVCKESCPSQGSSQEVLDALISLIERAITPQTDAIGIGVPSVVDAQKGIVFNVANIPSWKEVHLKSILETRFHLPVFVNNDANCFAKGVFCYGEGKGIQDMVGITLGTGVGAGVITNGQLYNGRNTGAGEIGSIPYLDSDFEHYCSSDFFERIYHISGREAKELASNGDAQALQIWDVFGRHVGKLVKTVLFAFDPEAIVFGGGISSAYPLFKDSLLGEIQDFPYPESLRNLTIITSQLQDVAILGAASLAE